MKSFKVIQRVISMLIAITLIVSTMPVVAGESNDVTSGVTDECSWSFDGETLTISGDGDMADYDSNNSPPWDVYKNSIRYINIEYGVSHIGEYAFEDCFEVFKVTIPGSVKSIGAGAFLCCTSLDYVNLPDGIVTIGGSAFKMCDLYSVRIPASVTNIGGGAFSLNFNFTGFTIDEENTVYSNDDYGALLNKDKTTLISVPCSVLEDRYTSNPLTEYTVPNSVTHIGYNAFYCCDELTSVTLPSSVETVASEAFTDCSRLNTVYYAGDESQRENIDFSGSNRYLVNATWYYNSCINKAEHDYTNNCDEECNTCSMKRVISHSYSDAQDTQCDVCDHTRVLKSIAITSYPDKLSYTELADNLDTTGGEITLYYNDNTSDVIEITSDMVSGFDNSIVGKQSLTITYDDKTCEYEVTIIKATDYFVAFCNWDNTVISTEVYHRGDKVAIPENPTKPSDNIYNYTFAGWDKEVVDCEGDATYTATYIAEYIDYTVTFKNWDETVLSTKTYHYGDVVTEPATPTRAKDKVYTYTFDSWDKEIVDCVENATYTATYTAEYIDYTVTFKNWDGTVLSTKSYHYGDEVIEPDAPTKEADDTYTYIFNGWDNPVTECTGNATYTAKYKSIPNDAYTITYHLDGGTNALKNPDMYTEEDTITLMDATKVGYDFAGWFLDPEKTKKISKIFNRTENLDLYAKFTPKSYTATFIDNGATKSSTLTITLDDSIGTTKKYYINNNESFSPYSYWIPKRDNYVFAGWYIGTQLVSDTIEATSDITLKAKWNLCDQYGSRENPIILGENSAAVCSNGGSYFYSEKLNYSWSEYPTEYLGYDTSDFSYNSGGWVYVYVYVSGEYQILNYEAECGERQDGTKRGYCEIYDVTKQQELVTFPPSYYDWDSYSGSFEVEPGSLLRLGVGYFMSAGYEDYWGELRISLGETRTGTISSTDQRISEQEFDSPINAPSVSKTGYKFLGWYDEQGNQITETWQYTADQTFKAKWQPIKYSVNYILDGGVNSSSNPSSYTIEDSITLKNPSKPGYTFKGWYSDSNYKTQVTNISNKTGNITLYAKFEVNSYNLTLDGNEGAFSPKITFISDETVIKTAYLFEEDSITAYRPENKDGYIFAGWYKDENCSSLFKFNGTLKSDIALYAKWVECNSNTIDIEALDKLDVVISGKTEQLYAFVPIADGKIAVTSGSDGLDLFGKLYDASKSVLISNDDISSTDLDFSYSYDVKAGQLYYIAVKGNTSLTSGDATINVKWTGGCTLKGTTYPNRQISVEYDTNYNLPEKPIREGYIFLGWFDENDTKVTSGLWKFSTDKTLTAKWEQTTYHTVTFKNLEGEIISSETYYISEDIVAPELPVKAPDETYTYSAKWDNNYTGVCTGDAVYSPIFEPTYIDYTITFVDEDGKELSKKTYHWGDKIIEPDAPTRPDDKKYIYNFVGWDKEVTYCEGDVTYTAIYDKTAIVATSIVITSEPDKLVYLEDEDFDETGMVVVAYYNNDTSEIVTDYTISGYDNTAGTKTITVTYGNQTATLTVEVKHNYEWIVDKENNCGVDGIKHEECIVCHNKINENTLIEATGNHNYEWIIDKENNCGVDGVKHEECSVCHIKQNENTLIEATGNHSYEWIIDKENNCGVDGVKHEECSVCHNEINVNTIIPATQTHSFDNQCDAICNVCEFERTVSHKVTIYDFSNDADYPFKLTDGIYSSTNKSHSTTATVTLTAKRSYSIKIEYYTSTEKDYDGLIIKHNKTVLDTISGNTTWSYIEIPVVAGDKIYISYLKDSSTSNGDDTIYFKLSPDFIPAETLYPTCESAIVCDMCGVTVKKALGHVYSSSCDISCNICEKKRDAIEKHTYDNICDSECNLCGYTSMVVIHFYESVCDSECDVCGYTRTAPHSYEWIIDKENNCGIDGIKHEECSVCHIKQNENTLIEATGNHSYEWIIDKENNCGVDGVKHEECSVCHNEINVNTIIPATGEHTYSDAEDVECDVCKYLKAKIGDIDGDGNITIMDATMIQRHIAQLTTITDDRIVCADTDKDGKVTILDATKIQRFIAQLIPEL